MSLTSWLKSGKLNVSSPTVPGLPDPRNMADDREAMLTHTANSAVETVVMAEKPSASRKRKRGEYSVYDDDMRAKIAKYSIDNGVAKASRKFSSDLGRKVSETTVRSMRDSLIKLKKTNIDMNSDPTSLPKSPTGKPPVTWQPRQ